MESLRRAERLREMILALFVDSAEDAKRLYGETIPSMSRGKRMFTFRAPVGV
jgi:hypothetical protein